MYFKVVHLVIFFCQHKPFIYQLNAHSQLAKTLSEFLQHVSVLPKDVALITKNVGEACLTL